MKKTFLTYEKPLLTAIIHCETKEECLKKIRRSLDEGAEAFGVQVNRLREEFHTEKDLREIFAACEGKPIYVTSYRHGDGRTRTEEECVDLLLMALRCGATLCDVMGDLYCPEPGGITYDPEAVEKQKALIREIHRQGAEVLISVHTKQNTSCEEVEKIAEEEIARGADILKIVVTAKDGSEVPAYLAWIRDYTRRCRKKLLFLASGEGELVRYLGPSFGVCMYLCVQEHGALDTKAQPLLRRAKAVRDRLLW